MTSPFASDQAPAVVDTWHRFRAHADGCEACLRVSAVVLAGTEDYRDFRGLHLMTCSPGHPLLEEWYAAVRTCSEAFSERVAVPIGRSA